MSEISIGSVHMKGGKGGQGRKRSTTRVNAKSKPRGVGKGGKPGRRDVPAKVEKTTTRLGANRVPDDA